MREKLESSIAYLEYTVDIARENLLEKYGQDHPLVKRMEEYSQGIEKQKKLIETLPEFFQSSDHYEICRISNIINSISVMIQDDARVLVDEINFGTSEKLPEDKLN